MSPTAPKTPIQAMGHPRPSLLRLHLAPTRLNRPSFLHSEDGAVTVDFVVLTAAAIALVTGFFAAFSPAINSFLQSILARLVT